MDHKVCVYKIASCFICFQNHFYWIRPKCTVRIICFKLHESQLSKYAIQALKFNILGVYEFHIEVIIFKITPYLLSHVYLTYAHKKLINFQFRFQISIFCFILKIKKKSRKEILTPFTFFPHRMLVTASRSSVKSISVSG